MITPTSGGPSRWPAYARISADPVSALIDNVSRWVEGHGAGALAVVASAGAGLVLGRALLERWRQARMRRGARLITILPGPRVSPEGGEAFWRNLLGLLRPRWGGRWSGQPHIGFEYLFTPDGITVRIWVPGTISPGLVARAVSAAWPGSRTHITEPDTHTAPAPAEPEGAVVAGGGLRLARDPALPIATGHGPDDPIRALLAAPGPLRAGEWAWVQVLARPVTPSRLARAARAGRPGSEQSPAPGARVGRVLGEATTGVLREILDLMTPGSIRRSPRAAGNRRTTPDAVPARTRLMNSAQDRAAAGKAHGSGYEVLIRYGTAAAVPGSRQSTVLGPGRDRQRGRDVGRALTRGRAHAIASSFAAFSAHNHYRRRRLRHPGAALRRRHLRRGDALSIPELAAIAHLPTDEHVAGLRRAGAAAIAAPPQIPVPGPGVKTLGDSDLVPGRPVGLGVADARHHLQIIGATGAGKSTLITHMVLDDADAGRGVLVLDPKGDLATDIAHHLHPTARRRTILIDPDQPLPLGGWPCLNPLAPPPGARDPVSAAVGDPAVENVVTVFARLFSSSWGARTEDLLRVACLTVRAGPETPTLAALPALLTEPAARARVTRHLPGDGELARYWRWFHGLSDPARAQITAPLLNKLRAVLLRPFARHVLCAGTSTVDLTDVLDNGGLLLVRLPKGALGEDTTRLVGSLIMAQAWQATTARTALPQHLRRDASLVVDECHNFLNLPYRIEDMLAEARGFRVSLTLAHQHLAQLPTEMRDGIATNARNKIVFTVGPDDARHLARHTTPELGPHDLARLDAFHAAARLVHHSADTPAFTLATRPLPNRGQPAPQLDPATDPAGM